MLTDVSISPHAPLARPNFTRCRVLPCLPTTLPTRSSSLAIRAFDVHDLVDRVGDLSLEAGPVAREADRKVAVANGLEHSEQF